MATLIALAMMLLVLRYVVSTNKGTPDKSVGIQIGGLRLDDSEWQLDQWVDEARSLRRSLMQVPLLTGLCIFFLAICLTYDVIGALSFAGGSWLVIPLIGVFVAGDLAVFYAGVSGDRTPSEWWRFSQEDRSPLNWLTIGLGTVLSLIVVLMAQSEFADQTQVRHTTQATTFTTLTSALESKRQQLAGLPVEPLPASELAEQAEAKTREAKRESYRGRNVAVVPAEPTDFGRKCGNDCKKLIEEARVLREREGIARQRARLQSEVASLTQRLQQGSQDGRLRAQSNAYGQKISYATGVDAWTANQITALVVGIISLSLLAIVSLILGERVRAIELTELQRRGAQADKQRTQSLGLPAKYVRVPELPPLIEAPPTTDEVHVHHVHADELKRRFANDPQLLEIHALFGSMLVRSAGENTPIDEIHRRYKIAALMANANASPATRPKFTDALSRIIMVRDDVVLSSGTVVDWIINPEWSAAQSAPTQEAAE